MMEEPSVFDARKLAAVVYDEGVAVDLLLEIFARDLAARGVRVAGVLHAPRTEAGCGPTRPIELLDLHTGHVAALCRRSASSQSGCAIDPEALPRAARSVHEALEADAEIVFFSRFGKQEVRGRGFHEELVHGALSRRVVLTAVRRGLVEQWLTFTGGVGTLLAPQLWVLEDWWRELDTRVQ